MIPQAPLDLLHCPAHTEHVIVGAGSGPCLVVCVGARVDSMGEDDWGAYAVDDAAARYGASVEGETTSVEEAYAHLPAPATSAYRPGRLPG